MKVTIIHGQSHKSSTYNIARQLCDKLDGEITEFFLPKDFECYCKGCATCFVDETRWEMLNPKIKRKIDNKTNLLAKKILSRTCKVKPTIKTRVFFTIMSIAQKKGVNEADANYWKSKGWTNGKKPWKN